MTAPNREPGDQALAALYQNRIRYWAAKVRRDRRLPTAPLSITRQSRTCGSSLTLDIHAEGEAIRALGCRARACTLGMAAAAIVVERAPGRTFAELAAAGEALRELLAGARETMPNPSGPNPSGPNPSGPNPSGPNASGPNASGTAPWADLDIFVAARAFPARHGSILLAFEALAEAAALRSTGPGQPGTTP